MSSIVVIALSAGVSNTLVINSKLGNILKSLEDYEIVAVNDKDKIVEKFGNSLSRKVTHRSCSGRISAKQIMAKADYLVALWTGSDLNDLIFYASVGKVPTRIIPFQITRVANKDNGEKFDTYIGRTSPWGNPFPIIPGTDETREVVIQKYKNYFHMEIVANDEKRKQVLSLRGLTLGCHCKPLPCHGDVIAEYLNNYTGED